MPIDAIVLFGGVAVILVLFAFAVWLLLFTPLIKWCFYGCIYAGFAYLAVQVLLLPFKRMNFDPKVDVRMLAEELLSKVDVTITTDVGPGQGLDQFALNVSG